jgi:hypothetical protein
MSKDKTVATRFDQPANTPLQGRRLILARLAWVAIAGIQVGIVAYGYPEYLRKLLSLNFAITPLIKRSFVS